MAITKQQRATIVKHIDDTTQYDADTLQISDDGEVTAKLDANKTFNDPHVERLLVGYVEDILREAAAV